MDVTAWTADLETGNDVLDAQHKRYLELVNNYLEKAAKSTEGFDQVAELAEKLSFLHDYALEHFATEEEIMRKQGYPGYESHRKQHQHFSRNVKELKRRLKIYGFAPALAREVNYYTIEWFMDHIRVSDMEVVDFLKQKSTADYAIPRFQGTE